MPAPLPSMAAGRQPLNPFDLAIRCADRSIRGMGYPGFETQMLVWLQGRIDCERLRVALTRLAEFRPVIASVLVEEAARDSRPYWQFRPAAHLLAVQELTSAEPSAVFAAAARLLSEIRDLAIEPPLRFHVLRLPDGADVLLVQYSHVLMDKTATLQLLREIDQWSVLGAALAEPPRHEPRRFLHDQLMRFSPGQRRAAARAAVELQGRTLRGRAAILGTGEEDRPRQAALRIATRESDSDVLTAIHRQSAQVTGLPNPSLAILASAFRAIRALGPRERNAERNYIAGIGLDMKVQRADRALLQNMLSVVPLFARPEELDDRDQLLRVLSEQLRDCLRRKVDWGVVRLVNGFQRKPRHMQWVVEHLLRWTYSLWYAYFGALEAAGDEFCGAKIEAIRYVAPTWSPVGLSLLANPYRGRLFFQATYDPDLIHDELANQFLDVLLEDLRYFALAS